MGDRVTGRFEISRKGGVALVEAESLASLPFVLHAFLCREGGVSAGAFSSLNTSAKEGDRGENIDRNWDIIASSLRVDREALVIPRQVHGDGIVVIEDTDVKGPATVTGDALVTAVFGVALCIRTADCVPLFIVDPDHGVIANVHAGWRGTAREIARRVVSVMEDRFGSRPSRLLAAIGPAIGGCCYEVDEDVAAAMGPWLDSGVLRPSPREGRWMLDLAETNRLQLTAGGLEARNVTVVRLCTACRRDLFFSHRRDGGRTGRQANILMLRNSLTREDL